MQWAWSQWRSCEFRFDVDVHRLVHRLHHLICVKHLSGWSCQNPGRQWCCHQDGQSRVSTEKFGMVATVDSSDTKSSMKATAALSEMMETMPTTSERQRSSALRWWQRSPPIPRQQRSIRRLQRPSPRRRRSKNTSKPLGIVAYLFFLPFVVVFPANLSTCSAKFSFSRFEIKCC